MPVQSVHPPQPIHSGFCSHLASLRLVMAVLLLLRLLHDSQHEVDHHGKQQNDGQEGRAEAVVEARLASYANRFRSPVVRYQGVDHGEHGNAGKEEGGDEGDAVTEVEHANGKGAKDDGEVEP